MATTDDGTAPPTTEDIITEELLEEEECDWKPKACKAVEEQKFLYEDTNNNKSIKRGKRHGEL